MKFPTELLRSFSIYTLSNLLNAALPFLFLPILTRWLSPAEFGVLAFYQVVCSLLTPSVMIGGDNAISRDYHLIVGEQFKIAWTQSNLLSFGAFGFFAVLIGVASFMNFSLISLSYYWIFIALFYALVVSIIERELALLRIQNMAITYGLLRLGRTLLDFGISIGLLLFLSKSWEFRAYGEFIAAVLFAVGYLVYQSVNAKWVFKIDVKELKRLLLFGAPLVLHTLSAVSLNFIDRVLIEDIMTIDDVGLYAVAYQIGLIIHMAQNSFNQAWIPFLYEKLKRITDELKLQLVQLTWLYIIGMAAFIAIFIIVGLPIVMGYFISESYAGIEGLVLWISVGYGFNGIYKMLVNYLVFQGKTRAIGLSTLAAAALNIVLNLWLIPIYGLMGAALSTAIAFGFHMLVIWYVCARSYPMPWFSKRVLTRIIKQ